MGHIAENILSLRQELPSGVELVAVSKFKSVEEIMEAYTAGQRVFGESPSPGTQGEGRVDAKGHRVAFHRSSAEQQNQDDCAVCEAYTLC